MSNKVELRERLRQELGDTAAVKTWSDTLLDALLNEAVGWYSRLWPLQATAFRDTVDGQRDFDVPSGAFGVTGVECPPGLPLPQYAAGTIAAPVQTGGRQGWSVWGGKVRLHNPASGGEVGAQKLVMRVLLAWERLDPIADWSGPEDDERLLVLWAATEAWAWLDGQDQKRGRPAKSGDMPSRSAEQLEREVAARRRAAGSRQLSEF